MLGVPVWLSHQSLYARMGEFPRSTAVIKGTQSTYILYSLVISPLYGTAGAYGTVLILAPKTKRSDVGPVPLLFVEVTRTYIRVP